MCSTFIDKKKFWQQNMRDILARDFLAFCTMEGHQSSCHDWKIATTTTT